ncbi:MAG: hypothetical protein IJV98_03735 [Clostridia bacterium]|nr:hypothetical protein [Clostridia bacterium]
MIKLIVGLKGSGKTKTLISQVNAATETSHGSVICLEKGDKLRFDIKYQARLIDVEEYNIDNAHGLRCFVAGLHASNSDITHIFIDSALKICKDDLAEFSAFVANTEDWAKKWNVQFYLTASVAEADLPEELKKYL